MPVLDFTKAAEKPVRPDVGGFVRRFSMGAVIGVACVTPGLSGGVVAAATGLYEPALHAFTHLRQEFKKGALYLLPLALGAGAGILLLGGAVKWLFAAFPTTMLYAFMGLVAGSLPALVKEANRDGHSPRHLLAAALAFAAVLAAEVLLKTVLPPAGLGQRAPDTLLCGAVVAAGATLPGISSTFGHIQLGVQNQLLRAASSFDVPMLALAAVGCGITALGVAFAADRLFKRRRGLAYHVLIGILAGSIVAVFPGFAQGSQLALDLLLFATCAAAVLWTGRLAPRGR